MSVRSEEQEVGPLPYDQLLESPPCEARALVGAHSLGHAEWAALVGPWVARVPGADERSGRHATLDDVLEIRLRCFFHLDRKDLPRMECRIPSHPVPVVQDP
jgi:hypothetical protein